MNCRCFGRVSSLGPGTVGLDVGSLGRIKAGLLIAEFDKFLLGCLTWGSNGLSLSILVQGSLRNHRTYRIAISDGLSEGLENDSGNTFTATIARGARVKGIAFSVRT